MHNIWKLHFHRKIKCVITCDVKCSMKILILKFEIENSACKSRHSIINIRLYMCTCVRKVLRGNIQSEVEKRYPRYGGNAPNRKRWKLGKLENWSFPLAVGATSCWGWLKWCWNESAVMEYLPNMPQQLFADWQKIFDNKWVFWYTQF